MFAVAKYYNYRKEQDFKIMHVYHEKDQAVAKAYELAVCEYGKDDVVDFVEMQYLYVPDAIFQYTTGDGFGVDVYAVLTLPAPE